MSKTPLGGVMLALLVAAGSGGAAVSAPGAAVRPAAEVAAAPIGSFSDAVAGQDAARPPMDFTESGSRAADLPLDAVAAPPATPLPLSPVAGGAQAPAHRGPFGFWELINQVRYGGLPEPASWTLMLIGFGMIGGALRGFMIANRRLAGLQPIEADDVEDPEDRP